MMVVRASGSPRSAIISTRSRKLSLKRKYQRTHRMMISRSKWRPENSSSMLFGLPIYRLPPRSGETITTRSRRLHQSLQSFGRHVAMTAPLFFKPLTRSYRPLFSMARCCMDPVLIAGERARKHIRKPAHLLAPSPCGSNPVRNIAIGSPRSDIGLRTGAAQYDRGAGARSGSQHGGSVRRLRDRVQNRILKNEGGERGKTVVQNTSGHWQ
jgi:hypothetical protein